MDQISAWIQVAQQIAEEDTVRTLVLSGDSPLLVQCIVEHVPDTLELVVVCSAGENASPTQAGVVPEWLSHLGLERSNVFTVHVSKEDVQQSQSLVLSGAVLHAAAHSSSQAMAGKVMALLEDGSLVDVSTVCRSPNATTNITNITTTTNNNTIPELGDLPFVVADLDLPPVTQVLESSTVAEALEIMFERDFDQVPVVDVHRRQIVGHLTRQHLHQILADPSRNAHTTDAVGRWMHRWSRKVPSGTRSHPYILVTPETTLANLQAFFKRNNVAFVTDDECKWVLGVCTKMDLTRFLQKCNRHRPPGNGVVVVSK